MPDSPSLKHGEGPGIRYGCRAPLFMLGTLAGDGRRSAQTSQILEGVLAALGQLHCDATAGDLSGGGQGVAGGHLGEVHRNQRSQNLRVAHAVLRGGFQVVGGADVQYAGPDVVLDDRLVELRSVCDAVERRHGGVVGLRATLALGECRDFNVVIDVPQQRVGDVLGGGESELEGHLQVRMRVQPGAALELALGVDGCGNPQTCTTVQACADATAGGEGAAAVALRGGGGCGDVRYLHGVGVQTVAGIKVVGGVRVECLGEDTELQGRGFQRIGGRRVGGHRRCGCDDGGTPRGTLDEGAAVQAVSGVRGRSHGISLLL
ncbi:hypothetical protein RMDY18_18370 [Rothia mucilaginosa DY-18]|uniref:Uncharacterized protein n=1 Tax=Rothia mucilaginosa (strain DY-18) TaxID=680646 RepID=D2NPV1_ROTMD|nr:hypothetical protein RMDY18_18370 [Rothia mucilaginosa DY-18]